jgi:transcriptional regulator with XRE-family HTH domain
MENFMIDQKLLGNRIKSLRVQKRLSQDKLGELAELNGKYLGEVERGAANISIVNLSKLADVLHVPLLALLSAEHERPRPELVSELHKLIDETDDARLKIIYRVIEAVTR